MALEDKFPTHYFPKVGRQVAVSMAKGGKTDQTLDLARSVLAEEKAKPAPKRAKAPATDKPPVKTAEGSQFKPVKYKSWDDVPTINPQDLVGKRIFPIFADLTKAGSPYEGIDSSKLEHPEPMYGGPGYPLLPESQKHGLAWAVQGKGRGSSKIRKDADYVVVHAMEQDSHKSNASFGNALRKTMEAYVNSGKLTPEAIQELNAMVRAPSEQKELKHLEQFPGFEHPDVEDFMANKSTFEGRARVAEILRSARAQALGAPNVEKVIRHTLDPEFAGVPSRAGMFLMKIPKGTEDEQLVHLGDNGLPIHPSYQYGIKGEIVGKFHHPVSPEILFKQWYDEKKKEAAAKEAAGLKTNLRHAFDYAMPVVTVSQEVADLLPRHPRDIQSAKAAKLALNAFNDKWHTTDDAVNKGGLGPADLSRALQNSDSSSTLSQYSQKELRDMIRDGKFTGYKLKDGEIYFGLKRGTNYADEYGFEHPDLTPNETALVSVVNNEPGAKGIGGAPVVLKAIQHGATALDAYAVPSKKHPNGFLPDFYSHFGFEELGRIPFDPKYVSEQQFEDMKHEWTKAGWDEKMGLPSISIMKWRGSEDDRQDAVRRFIQKSGEDNRAGASGSDVRRSTGPVQQGSGPSSGAPQRGRKLSDASGDRGPVGADNAPRFADRLTRTLRSVRDLPEHEHANFGVSPEDIALMKASPYSNFARGGVAQFAKDILRNRSALADGGVPDDLTKLGFYSQAARTAAALPQPKGTPDQMKAMLLKQGVKPGEIENANYDATFAGKPSVTRDELAQHFTGALPNVEETVLGTGSNRPPKYQRYVMPGGQNYREVLLHNGNQDATDYLHRANTALEEKIAAREALESTYGEQNIQAAEKKFNDASRRFADLMSQYDQAKGNAYKHGHWDEHNVLAHLRMHDRVGEDGAKLLHLEELQSDWGQEAHKNGMRDPKNPTDYDNELVPHHPLVANTGSWVDLGLKRALKEAAAGGYDRLVITPGEEQVKRFNLAEHFRKMVAEPNKDGTITLHAYTHEDDEDPSHSIDMPKENLDQHVGKEIAEKLLSKVKFPEEKKVWRVQSRAGTFRTASTEDFDKAQRFIEGYPEERRNEFEVVPVMEMRGGRSGELVGDALKIGGGGMKSFYDKIVPKQLQALAKKLDPEAKVGVEHIAGGEPWPHTISIGHDGKNYWLHGMHPETQERAKLSGNFDSYAEADDERQRMLKGLQPVHSIAITPKMREEILKGQRLFADGGAV